MSGTISTRWYFSDWMSDTGLRACSLAARGLWMDLLCIASANKDRDHGFVMVGGRKMETPAIARMVGATVDEVESLLDELEQNGVFSRDRRGIIYSRRMVKAEKNRRNGELGGNPNLMKNKENKNSVQPNPKAHIPEPEPEPLFSDENSTFPKKSGAASGRDDWPPPEQALDQFWSLYPPYRRTAKKTVASKLATLRKSGEVSFARLMAGLQRYVDSNPGEFAKGPVVWLNGGCWDDEIAPRSAQAPRQPRVGNGLAALLIERRKQQQMGDEGDGYERGFFGEAESISDRSERRY